MKNPLRSRVLTLFLFALVAVVALSQRAAANPPGFGGSFEEVVRLGESRR